MDTLFLYNGACRQWERTLLFSAQLRKRRANWMITEQEYQEFIQPYIDARNNLLTRLETLNKDFKRKYQNNPIHYIQSRIKKLGSIQGKLLRQELEESVENAKLNLKDIAGIRVICYFVDDIYNTAAILEKQSDMIVIKEADYIKRPKPNGYRSYHLVLGVPVYYTDGMEYFPVEIQFRTMSMDFWASMEHRICYKKQPRDKQMLADEFYGYAEVLREIEGKFEQYNEKYQKV